MENIFNEPLPFIYSVLRGLNIAIKNIIIYPAATILIAVFILFFLKNATPGEALVSVIESARPANASESEFFVHRCVSDDNKRVSVCKNTRVEIFNKGEYIKYINNSWSATLVNAWLLLAIIFCFSHYSIKFISSRSAHSTARYACAEVKNLGRKE